MQALLEDGLRSWSAEDLRHAGQTAQEALHRIGSQVVASLLDNSASFLAIDEACAAAGLIHSPLPLFFSAEQIQLALQSAGVDTLVAEPSVALAWRELPWEEMPVADRLLQVARLRPQRPAYPADTQKITYTSGSTGRPKGVCLRLADLEQVADGVVQALRPLNITRHLSALPYSVLLENVAGQMAARRQGATLITLPMTELGWTGSSQFDPARFHAAVQVHEPHSLIVLPQMLRAWCAYLQQSRQTAPGCLKFVAVGGAAVGAPLLASAHTLKIPAFEGYGLSEGASVQTLNLPGAERPGSVGRVLSHSQLRLSADGEIQIRGSLMAGYLGQSAPMPQWWPSGDLGEIDADGYVYIRGRKKNLLISSYGRNICPEWVETVLTSQAHILQAVVFGDGEPELWAVIWPAQSETSDQDLQDAIDRSNATLPDYARIARWMRAKDGFHTQSGYATANGRPRRASILAAHAPSFTDRSETTT